MPNIDNLSINIKMPKESVIANIDAIIKKLGELNGSLAVSTQAKDFKRNINSLTEGFYELGQAIEGLDVAKIKSLNNSIGTLARNLGSLQGVKTTLTDIGRVTVYSGKTKSEIEAEIEKFELLKSRAEEVKSILQSIGSVGVSSGSKAEAGDEWASYNGYLKNIQKGGARRGINPDAYDTYYQAFGEMLPMNEDEAIRQYGEAIKKAADDFSYATNKLADLRKELDRVPEGYERVKESMQSMSSVMGADGSAIAYYGGGLPWEEGIEQVKVKAEEVKQVGNPFANIVVGLQSLETVNIPAEQFAGLSMLASGVTKMSNADLPSVVANLPVLAQGLKQFENFVPTNTEGIVSLADSLAKLGYKKVVNASTALPAIAAAMTEISGITIENTPQIENLATALNGFGRAGVRHATEVLPTLTTQLQQLLNTLANSPQISNNLVRLTESLAQFSTRANGVNSALPRATSNLNLFGRAAHGNRIHIRSLASVIGMLYAKLFLAIRLFKGIGKAIDLSSQFTEAQNVVEVAFGKMSDKLYDFADTSIKTFGLSRLAASQYASRFQAMGKTMGIASEEVVKANERIYETAKGNPRAYKDLGDSVSDMSINLTKLTADLASLYNQDYDDVAADMQSIYTGMTRPMRKYGIDLSAAAMKEYALKNGIEGNVTAMTQAQKTMLRYQMVMTQASGAMGDFEKTANTWANSMRTVKQLLGEIARTIGEGFINALLPALNAFKQFLFNFLGLTENALNAIGKLLGWKQINFGGASLVEETEDYAEALDDAAGSAKKLKGQLRGIDELNNLTTNNPGGGGGGADGAIGANGGNLWDNIIDTEKAYESSVKDWEDFGKRIADTITNGLTNINWNEYQDKARKFGKNFASFLNGIFDPKMFGAVGNTIAESLNTAIYTSEAFGEEFDAEKLGQAISRGINSFFTKFDFYALGHTLKTFAIKVKNALKKEFDDIDWVVVLDGLTQFLDGVGFTDLVEKYHTFFRIPAEVGKLQLQFESIEWEKVKFEDIITALDKALGDKTLFGKSKLNKFCKAFGDWLGEEIAQAIKEGTSPAGKIMQLWSEGWKNNLNKLFNFFETFDAASVEGWGKILQLGIDIIGGVIKGIEKKISGKNDIFSKILMWFLNGIKNVFGIASPAKSMYSIGENIVLGIIEGFKNVPFLAKINEWFETVVKPFFNKSKWESLGKTVKDKLSNTLSYNNLYNIGSNMGRGLYNAFTSYLTDLYNAFLKIKAQIESTSITQTVNVVAGSVTNLVNAAYSVVETATEEQKKQNQAALSTIKNATATNSSGNNYNKTKTTQASWHNLPTRPYGMSASEWDAYLKKWKENNPGNFYAKGGFPSLGSLMIAGESGAELVGNINGRTGVASNVEITGISETIRQTASEEIALLRQEVNLLQELCAKEFGISKDTLFRSVQSSASDFRTRTGRPAF